MKKLVVVLSASALFMAQSYFASACPQTIELLKKVKESKTNEVLRLRERERAAEIAKTTAETETLLAAGELRMLNTMIEKITEADKKKYITTSEIKAQAAAEAVQKPAEAPCENCGEEKKT